MVVLKLFIIVLCDFVYFVMCRVVYVWVLYCMDVRGLFNNVSVDMVGIVMVCMYCNVWGCVCVGFVLYGCVRLMF